MIKSSSRPVAWVEGVAAVVSVAVLAAVAAWMFFHFSDQQRLRDALSEAQEELSDSHYEACLEIRPLRALHS